MGILNDVNFKQFVLSTTAEDSNKKAFDATSMILIMKKVCDSKVTSVVLQKVSSEGLRMLLILNSSLVSFVANVSVMMISDS